MQGYVPVCLSCQFLQSRQAGEDLCVRLPFQGAQHRRLATEGRVGAEWNGQKAQKAENWSPRSPRRRCCGRPAHWRPGSVRQERRNRKAVLIPGATVFKRINPPHPIVATSYPVIGIHLHHDPDPQVVKYSQNALDSDRAILDGVEQAGAVVRQNDGKVVIIGESMGSMVASESRRRAGQQPRCSAARGRQGCLDRAAGGGRSRVLQGGHLHPRF